MVTKDMVNVWRGKNAARLAENGLKMPELTKLYAADFKARDEEVLAWVAVEEGMLPLGFAEFHMADDGRFMTKYGDIECRVFLQHKDNGLREYTVTALLNNQVLEAASFQVTFDKKKPVFKQVSFSVTNLVLPQKNS